MNNLVQRFVEHIKFDNELEDGEIAQLLALYPQALYSGVGYRVIRSLKPRDISQDKSFTKSKEGVVYMTQIRDMEEISVYQVNLEGLDVIKLCQILKESQQEEFPAFIYKEQEVICLNHPQNIQVLFQGLAKDFK